MTIKLRLVVHYLKGNVALLSSDFESSVAEIFTDFLKGTVLGASDTAMGSVNLCSYTSRQKGNKQYIL